MISHVIAFDSPVTKVYDILPPLPDELDEVLAIMFTGPCKPTEKDYQRTPMLVRRRYVYNALTWLKLNHPAYHDLNISMENLNMYAENIPPVSVEWKPTDNEGNRISEGTSVHDNEPEIGTEQGEVPFVVHGLTGENLQNETVESQKAKALAHLNAQGKFLAVGHSKESSTIFKNPKLYPSIFPWLFPYGLGGFGMNNILKFGEKAHKKFLLNYHDKQFQTDITFPFVAFSHEQIKAATSNGFAMTELQSFPAIADHTVLTNIIQRLERGEMVRPETEEEKACFSIIQDLDHVGGGVKGAPSWYITFAPSDTTHPLCLYYAGTHEKFQPNLKLPDDDRTRQVIRTPVSGAKFFDFMVRMFIKHILGVDSAHDGLFGKTSAYYETVEQQGRLTLHLHMLLWIAFSRSPQEIRDAILDPNSDFQKKIVEYLESVHTDELMDMEVVNENDSDAESTVSDTDSDISLESDEEDDDACEAEYLQGPKPMNKETLSQNMFPFLHGHPLADTHAMKVGSNAKRLVPNFIGGTLRRADKGNREYYCTVMLTLFKPWRNGKILKHEDQSWDDAFTNFQFTAQQKQVLKNFQVRYECLDSRDDYNAQRKTMSNNAVDADIIEYEPEYDDGIDSELLEISDECGPFERRRQEDMNEMTGILVGMGWTDNLHDRKSLIPQECQPEVTRSAHSWKLQINKMRQDILDKRHKSSANQDTANKFKNRFPNQVEILDKTAFETKTRQGQTQNLIDTIANEYKFHDNPEQNRAFRIIANHTASPCPEQLKMYIGGMGGTGKSTVLRALRKFFAERNESHRMLVVAPTGSAAALLAGSTYHYMFGINSKSEGENHSTSIPQICSRLEGVNYVFLDEVEILPNFAMTDFASQGKTRDWNVVDIHNSRDFRAIYTALSRSSCADQTLILQGFNTNLLTGGIKNKGGYRQELRELEFLDEITRLKYLGILSPSVFGDRRSSLIKSFRTVQGINFVPASVHKSIEWNDSDPLPDTFDSGETWQIISADNETDQKNKRQLKGNFKTAKGATQNETKGRTLKRKAQAEEPERPSTTPKKKIKEDVPAQIQRNSASYLSYPSLRWFLNSCAHDSAIILLYYLYVNHFEIEMSHFTQILSMDLLDAFRSGITDLTAARENVRCGLHNIDSEAFSYGQYADAGEVLLALTQSDLSFSRSQVICTNNHVHKPWKNRTNMLLYMSTRMYQSTQQWVDNFVQPFGWQCQICHTELQTVIEFTRFPKFFLLYVPINASMEIDRMINLTVNGNQKPYDLKAIIYFGEEHFILRIFSNQAEYIYDGIKNGVPHKASILVNGTESVTYYDNKKAAVLLYGLFV
ncbi:hypothetical protein D9758_014859 [Tetrapyrgos nigripes]|uniref:ATP-dependent DNA helicase n=1 Tax=Tetrapyrgos nigripes TaxID=182062 RepID=A0A8H5FS61_9AGAR|nr:hypothetical protein D9758_014859 [Tetrapyrgos nigripes]